LERPILSTLKVHNLFIKCPNNKEEENLEYASNFQQDSTRSNKTSRQFHNRNIAQSLTCSQLGVIVLMPLPTLVIKTMVVHFYVGEGVNKWKRWIALSIFI